VDPRLADPKRLERVLEIGVTVVAAHGAGRSALWDPDWSRDLMAMMGRHPRLFTDNSATCSPNRWRTVPLLLEHQERVVHGSDYPVPVGGLGPWLGGLVTRQQWRAAAAEPNVIKRDVLLKQAMGFGEDTFTRLSTLLPAIAWRQ
jgi:hypothetical protein